ncbi:hypothetical protein [Gordonia terrae]
MSGTESPTVVLAGGSGSLGTHLATDLAARGYHPVILTRRIDPVSRSRGRTRWTARTPIT